MSTDAGTPSALSDAPQRLYNVYEQDDLWVLLELDAPWKAKDLPCTDEEAQAVMNRLRAMGAITIVDTVQSGAAPSKRCHVYEFADGVRELLEDYRERKDRFDCGHRVHVHHKDGGGFGCQYCDEPRDFDREVVKEAIA